MAKKRSVIDTYNRLRNKKGLNFSEAAIKANCKHANQNLNKKTSK